MVIFQAEGENVSKLEKADILELTVRHLHRLRRSSRAGEEAFRFQVSYRLLAGKKQGTVLLKSRGTALLRLSNGQLFAVILLINYILPSLEAQN